MAHRNIDMVINFCAAWSTRDVDNILAFIAPDCFYHNIPMEPLVGLKSIREALSPSLSLFSHVEWEVIAIAETSDGTVLTERNDRMIRLSGSRIEIPVMGSFRLTGGLINRWLDYFDDAKFMNQLNR